MSRTQEIRDAKKALRNAIQAEQRIQAEQAILTNLCSLTCVTEAECIGIYLATDGEPDISTIGSDGRAMALPVALSALGSPTIKFGKYCLGDPLVKGRFRIYVPAEFSEVDPTVIISPLVAFDEAGARVGRGGGFYDSYFSSNEVIRVGVGFEVQRADKIPTEPHDQYLDYMVTETTVREFNRTK